MSHYQMTLVAALVLVFGVCQASPEGWESVDHGGGKMRYSWCSTNRMKHSNDAHNTQDSRLARMLHIESRKIHIDRMID